MSENGRRFADDKERTKVIDLKSRDEEREDISEAPESEEPRPDSVKHQKPNNDQKQKAKKKNPKKLEKLMKKQRRRERNTRREVLTYEDMPLDERRTESNSRKANVNKKRIITAAVILVLVFIIVFFAFSGDRFSMHNISNFIRYGVLNSKSDESFPLNIQGESISAGNFQRIGQDICYSSDTKTQLLNNYGRSVYTAQHAFINPVLVTGSRDTLVYNLGGTGFQIIGKDGNTFNSDAQDNILVADITDNGAYALVTQSSGYLSKLYVYNEEHEQIFAYSFADYYVTSVSLNSSGSRAVVSGVSALDGMDIASLYVLDFTKDTPLFFFELENNIIYEISYLNDKCACAIGRSASYTVNTRSGTVETASYEGRDLTAYDINADTDTFTLSLSSSGDGRNCNILSYNSNGREERSFTIDEKIIDLSTYKGRVALLTNDSVLLYSKDGNRISEKLLSSDPHSVALYTIADAYILCTGYIDTVSF